MSTWNERLVQAMERQGVSLSDLGMATKISPAGIKKWVMESLYVQSTMMLWRLVAP